MNRVQAFAGQHVFPRAYNCLYRSSRPSQRFNRIGLKASSGSSASLGYVQDPKDAGETEKDPVSVACPICQRTKLDVDTPMVGKGVLECGSCLRSFDYSTAYMDLTLTSGLGGMTYKEAAPVRTSTFQNPLVSLVYERGWRQNFNNAGFPGKVKEFEYAMEYLDPVLGGVVMDLSCGSGLFTRRLAACGKFSQVVAVDYSESMLKQTQRYLERGEQESITPVLRVRADVERLPFLTGSISAIHSGAALHCWSSPLTAMAEISRVLKPGGVFVASTFLTYMAFVEEILGDSAVKPIKGLMELSGRYRSDSVYKFFEEQELRDLAEAVGLQDFQRRRNQLFIMFRVTKPDENTSSS